MSDRITMGQFGEHPFATLPEDGYSAKWSRVKFVKKTLAEVGDGSIYPIEVTIDQLNEIIYRVKDSEVISGSVNQTTFGDTYKLELSGVPKPNELLSKVTNDLDSDVSVRGLCAITAGVSPVTPLASTPAAWFGTPYYFAAADVEDDLAVADIQDSESAIWASVPDSPPGYYWDNFFNLGGGEPASDTSDYRTAFSHYFGGGPILSRSLYGIFGVGPHLIKTQSVVNLWFTGEVAFVDNAANGNPFDNLNKLYLGARLDGDLYAAVKISISTVESFVGGSLPLGKNLILELSDSQELQCPLYFSSYAASAAGDDPGYIISATDFRFKADKSWPYKTTAGADAWDTTTGLPVNGGPAA